MTNSSLTDLKLKALLNEPTLHFFAIAVAIFALYAIFQSRGDKVLELDQREIDARIFMQEMATGESLTEEQSQLIASLYVEEQILVQEAITMGLDNDIRIHDMLAQKMRHVLSGGIIQPSEAELQAYYEANLSRYETLPTVSVDELVFDTQDTLSEDLVSLLNTRAEPQQLLTLEQGNASPLPRVNHIDLSNIFEPELADSVFSASIGQWSGPFVSNRGQHWLRVTERVDARLPSLSEISDQVRLDWITEKEEALLQVEIDKLWDQYTVVIKDAGQE
ncbi:MAG: peptidyl-prolyl cis-trans isomerase [Pseudomonadota bacterium]|nr:peptidyl-prolyl cis-trans isomerase [Pseudomonadota bacterium]